MAAGHEDPRSPAPVAAELLGLHLEGPFLSPEKAGAHAVDRLRPVDPGEIATCSRSPKGPCAS
ncbi:MAG: hypothetical protein ACM3RP_13485 [Chitinophagales bacterium]